MKWVFSAFVVLRNLRAIEGPVSADLWPNDVFTKVTPGKSLETSAIAPLAKDVLWEVCFKRVSLPGPLRVNTQS